nr:MAG TPA: hypothetical protein [Caudoviricetes sp.]
MHELEIFVKILTKANICSIIIRVRKIKNAVKIKFGDSLTASTHGIY